MKFFVGLACALLIGAIGIMVLCALTVFWFVVALALHFAGWLP